ncbi:hypothetical protein [Nocardiopsis alba]|uniref:hypothetical protein n=1 Tax=Nocardiopsis alba TaxID=53437 RepID=UPI0035DB3D1A
MNPSPSGRALLVAVLTAIGRHRLRATRGRRSAVRDLWWAAAGRKRSEGDRHGHAREATTVGGRAPGPEPERARVPGKGPAAPGGARARWVPATVLSLILALYSGLHTWEPISFDRELDDRGRTGYARVIQHNGDTLSVLHHLDGERLLLTIAAPTGAPVDREGFLAALEEGRQVWIEIDVLPDAPGSARAHGERSPLGAAALGAVAFSLAAALAFALHLRAWRSGPRDPEGAGPIRRALGNFEGVSGAMLAGCGVVLVFLPWFDSTPVEPMVDPRTTTARAVDHRPCSGRWCFGYDTDLVYRVQGVEYRMEAYEVPFSTGAEVRVRYPAVAPETAGVVNDGDLSGAGRGVLIIAVLYGVIIAFSAPVLHSVRRGRADPGVST